MLCAQRDDWGKGVRIQYPGVLTLKGVKEVFEDPGESEGFQVQV